MAEAMGRRAFSRLLGAALIVGGTAAVAAGARTVAAERESLRRYAELASAAVPEGDARAEFVADPDAGGGEVPEGVDWGYLLGENPSTCAWCSLPGLGIDVPVVLAAGGEGEDWWLSHDFFGAESPLGCAFVDRRCEGADDAHVMCLGHHVAGVPEAVFSRLSDCYLPEAFGGLGELLWSTPAEGTLRLRPLCAARVREDDEGVQAFGLAGEGELRAFLEGHAGRCEARDPQWRAMAGLAERAVTLVTCSSDIAGQPWRAAATFVA